MADVFKAFDFLNKSLKLGLSRDQIFRAEAAFKQQFLQKSGFSRIAAENVNDWEFFAFLAPAKKKGAAKARKK